MSNPDEPRKKPPQPTVAWDPDDLPFEQPFATILTMVEVDRDDAAFQNPTKPIGPLYNEAEAKKLAAERGWTVAPEGKKWRRVVPSPVPMRVFEIRPIDVAE